MSHAYFPDTVPEGTTLDLMMAKRKVVEGSEARRCLVKIREDDADTKEIDLPGSYYAHMQRFVWRETAIRVVLANSETLGVGEGLQDTLKQVLWYMCGIFERIGVESRKAIARQPQWRSEAFDNYLKIEYHVMRHEPWLVREFRRNNDTNLDRSKPSYLRIPDWKAYDAKLGNLWSGSRLRYTISERQEKDKRVIEPLHECMKKYYDPIVEEDTDFGYTFKEHLESSDEDQDGSSDIV
ncbi:hypothetical protein PISMIDRAFT_24005 [Pisolithus microcarpus 441]|uniref:Uncharacterized protein n=1 Tax=Pisolithus microcarpus 441 TaxID=765257 RepID=A0A0C9ZMQ1_9AGAM|nr:hypothetical protein BKA83DRAFT_24005 [Pisolithus microcarpus]KIK21078.1 hypothetical protein PISMIDRAFT_24005 [Pisolithus microcarpus 441]